MGSCLWVRRGGWDTDRIGATAAVVQMLYWSIMVKKAECKNKAMDSLVDLNSHTCLWPWAINIPLRKKWVIQIFLFSLTKSQKLKKTFVSCKVDHCLCCMQIYGEITFGLQWFTDLKAISSVFLLLARYKPKSILCPRVSQSEPKCSTWNFTWLIKGWCHWCPSLNTFQMCLNAVGANAGQASHRACNTLTETQNCHI